jgi:hypothetical protein
VRYHGDTSRTVNPVSSARRSIAARHPDLGFLCPVIDKLAPMPKNALYFVSIAFIFYVAVGLDDCLICFYVATLFFTRFFCQIF